MVKNIKFMAILFAFVMQSMTIWSYNIINGTKVYLQYKTDPKTKGNHGSTRAPVKSSIPLTVFIDNTNQQLELTDPSNGVYSYSIYDENEEIMSQGTLNFTNGDSLYIDLWDYQSGVYSLEIIYGGSTYCGTFEIE